MDAYPRPLTEREAEILVFLLKGADDPRLDPLIDQARTAVVTGRCSCGCATVNLAVDRETTTPVNLCSPVVSAHSLDDVPPVGLLLFLDEGWLSLLEIWYIDEPPAEFPATATFEAPRIRCDDLPMARSSPPPRSHRRSSTPNPVLAGVATRMAEMIDLIRAGRWHAPRAWDAPSDDDDDGGLAASGVPKTPSDLSGSGSAAVIEPSDESD
jgi:hypothetical protein